MPDQISRRNPPYLIGLISVLLFAFILRLAFFFVATFSLTPDARAYDQIARNITEHGSFSESTKPPLNPLVSRMPGYPLFLSGLYKVAGHNFTVALIAQVLLDLVAVLMLAIIARHLGLHPVLTAMLAAVTPFTGIFSHLLLTEALTTLLATLALFVALRSSRAPSLGWSLALGFILGITIEVRAEFAVFAVLVVLWLLFSWRRSPARAARYAVLITAVTLAVMTPWAVRNKLILGHLTPFSVAVIPQTEGYWAWARTWHKDGWDLKYSIWPYLLHADPQSFRFKPHAFASPDERKVAVTLLNHVSTGNYDSTSLAASERGFKDLARVRGREHPLHTWVVLPVVRSINVWREAVQSNPFPRYPIANTLFNLATMGLLLLAVPGIILLRREPLAVLLLMLLGFRTLVPVLIAGVEARYLVPAFPALYIFAGATLTRLWPTHPDA